MMRIYVLQLIVAGMAATIYMWILFTLKRAITAPAGRPSAER